MACKECEALCLLAEKTCGEVSVAETNLAVVSYGTRDAECLETFSNSLSGVSGIGAALLDCDGGAYYVSPLCILEADFLGVLASLVWIEALGLADGLGLLEVLDTVFVESSIDRRS